MSWERVAVVVAGAHAAALADALESQGALSVEIADADAGTPRESAVFAEPGAEVHAWPRCRVTALFASGVPVPAALEAAFAASGASALEGASVDRLADADWVAQTQRDFQPIRAGRILWIVPTWHAAPVPGAVNIVLDPGAAFGTGSHPTTRLCLAWLEREVLPGDSVLDYGCGSGILGIAALRLGAGAAVGVDIDPLALEAARYNSRQNEVALEVAHASEPIPLIARITVANILANPLRMLAPLIAAHTAEGGRVALSGILDSQAADVIDAYAPWVGLAVEAEEESWVLLAGTRRG